jgi:hypothetical protein
MFRTAPLPLESPDSKRAFQWGHQPLGPKTAAYSLLFARALFRRQQLGESLKERFVDRTFSRRVSDADLDDHEYLPIPRVPMGALNAQVLRAVIARGVPTVLEGAALESVALHRWSLDCLAENYGDTRIPLFPEHSDSMTMRIDECIEEMKAGRSPGLQINNVCALLTDPDGMLNDLPIKRFAKLAQPVRYHGANLFVCRSGDGSKYHCANELNFFFQVVGRKEWHFVHPRFTPNMDPSLTVPRCSYFGSGVNWGEHPAGVPIGRVVLNPGDVLVNPPWWWHWVRNLDTTIGVATRWYTWRHRFGTDGPFLTFLQWLFPHQWRIMWQDYVQGGRLDDAKWVHRGEGPSKLQAV